MRPVSVLLALFLFAVPNIVRADEIGPEEEVCQRKQAGDACIDLKGAAGKCTSVTDPRGRTRLYCFEAVPSSSASKSQSRCSMTPGAQDTHDTVPWGLAIGTAAFGLALLRRRVRSQA